MKPLELKIKGLNSFRGEQTIDFRRLGEYSLFGIFGPTGSGKSSILDAVILALYGVVPRAGNSAAGIINQMEDAAEVSFRFELAEAGGRQEFLIQRRYRREKNSPDSARFASGRLVRVNGSEEKVLASKDSELKTMIVELLGLSAQDFTRAVVLPQGRFAEFLALRGRERTDMLERIFALEQFGEQLNRSLKDRLDEAALAQERLQSEMNGIGDASAEALELAGQALEQAGQEAAAAKEEEKAARDDHEVQRRVWGWQEAYKQASEAMELHQGCRQDIEHLVMMAARARRAEEIRPLLKAAELLERELQAAESELQAAQEEESNGRKLADARKEELHQAEQKWQEKAPLINTRLEKLREVLDLEVESAEGHREVSLLLASRQSDEEALSRLQHELTGLEETKKSGEANLELLARQREKLWVEPERRERVSEAIRYLLLLEKAEKNRLALAENLAAKETELAESEQALNRAAQGYEDLLLKIADASQHLENNRAALRQCIEPAELGRQQYILEHLKQARSTAGQYTDKASGLQDSIAASEEENRRILIRCQELEAKKATLQETINTLNEKLQSETDQNLAAHLAGLLTPGEPCPVCGALDHPQPARAEHDRRSQIEKDISQCQNESAEIERALSGSNTEIAAVQTSLTMQEKAKQEVLEQLKAAQLDIETWLERLPAELRSLSSDEAAEWLEKRRSEYEERLAESRGLEQVLKTLEGNRGLALAAREKQTGIVNHSRSLLAELSLQLEAAIGEENELNRLFLEKTGGMEASALRGQDGLIRQQDQQAEVVEREWQKTSLEMQKINRDLDQVRLNAGHAEQNLIIKKTDEANQVQALIKLDGQIQQVTGGEPAGTIISELEQDLQGLEKGLDYCRRQSSQADGHLEADVKRLSAAQSRSLDLTGRHKEALVNLDEALTRCQFASVGDARSALSASEEISAWEGAIRTFEDEGKELTHQINTLEEQLQGTSMTREQWEAGQVRLQQAAETSRAAFERVGASNKYWQDLQQKNVRWTAIAEEQGRWSEQIQRLQLLQGLLRGKEFVKYIAGEQLRYICQSASLRLQQLSRSRYALELDSDNNFVIRDDHNGGLRRAVATLSGGETFLASLALALALSAQIQLHGQYPLEFFFLDEGFGTLDPELLETVMNSLENLRHERFMVGIISHVPELRNRLPRCLQVIPAEPGGAGTQLQLA